MSDSECFDPFKEKHTSLLPVGKGKLGLEHITKTPRVMNKEGNPAHQP